MGQVRVTCKTPVILYLWEWPIHKNVFYFTRFSLLDASFGTDPVPESSHSRVDPRLIGLCTFISPAHYSSKIPDISSIWTNQWSSRVTLQEKGEVRLVINNSVLYGSILHFSNLSLMKGVVFESFQCAQMQRQSPMSVIHIRRSTT